MTFRGCIPWNRGKPWPEEIKKKISESLKGRPKPWNSHPPSEATRIKLSEALKGKPAPWNRHKGGGLIGTHLSEEHKRKISKALKGHIAWNKGKTGIYSKERLIQMSKASKGNTYGAANKGRISERRGKTGIYSAETIIKMRESANRRWSKKSERKKQSIAKLGSIPWMKGKHHTEESKRKMSETKQAKRLQKSNGN